MLRPKGKRGGRKGRREERGEGRGERREGGRGRGEEGRGKERDGYRAGRGGSGALEICALSVPLLRSGVDGGVEQSGWVDPFGEDVRVVEAQATQPVGEYVSESVYFVVSTVGEGLSGDFPPVVAGRVSDFCRVVAHQLVSVDCELLEIATVVVLGGESDD